jgi:hypothetical protein
LNHSVSDEVPEGWNHIIDSFLTVVDHDVRLNNGAPIHDVTFRVRHNTLSVVYSGGDRNTDHYALFAQVMSTNTCTGCGLPATRRVFESPKCDDCF